MRPLVANLGCGIDSSAALALIAQGDPRVADLRQRLALVVTADLRTERDETVTFVSDYLGPYLAENGCEIHAIDPQVKGRDGQVYSDLYEYHYAQACVPSRMRRSCTHRFKIVTSRRYAQDVLDSDGLDFLIGFDAHETKRANKIKPAKRYGYVFPLIEHGITRLMSAKVLLDAGLPVPPRSACFCCPFASAQDWYEMRTTRSALYAKCVELENHVEEERGRFIGLAKRPLRDNPMPRTFKMPADAIVLYERAKWYMGRTQPAWPSHCLCLAARDLYGETWPDDLLALKLGPKTMDDPWQIYIRIEYCLELGGYQLPLLGTLPCGAQQVAEPITLPSAGLVAGYV